MSKHTHCRWQLDKGSWISNDVKDENRCVWVLESDYLNMKESLEAENARLKAEVERLTERNQHLEQIDSYLQSANLNAEEQRSLELEAQVERLTKAALQVHQELDEFGQVSAKSVHELRDAAKGVQS